MDPIRGNPIDVVWNITENPRIVMAATSTETVVAWSCLEDGNTTGCRGGLRIDVDSEQLREHRTLWAGPLPTSHQLLHTHIHTIVLE